MEKGLVSIIMGIYNIQSEEVLRKSIESILQQTYQKIEFIIIDDGSTNATYEWACKLTEGDERVILLRNKKNLGLTKTLNRCLKYAKGEYIARMDGDDYSALDRFEKQVEFLQQHEEYGLVSTNMYNFDDNGVWGERKSTEIIQRKDFLFANPIMHPTVLTYKRYFEMVGNYKESWMTQRCEDYDLFMRMYAEGVKMYTIQEALHFYREDKYGYSKRKYKYRFSEMLTRARGFCRLHLYPLAIPYVIKPLIVGLLPPKLLRELRVKFRK